MNYIMFLPIAIALAVYFARMLELKKKRDVIEGPVHENLTFKLFFLVGIIMLIGSITEFVVLREAHFSWAWAIIGVVVALLSFWLRLQAIKSLGKFWSLHIEIRGSHEFVQSGPFRWVRHPTYLSMIMELLAVGLILNAWWMLMLIPFLFIPALVLRIKKEEVALIEKFGEAYRDYQKTTPAVIPGIKNFLK